MQKHEGILGRALRVVHGIEDGLLAFLLGVMVLVAPAQIALRNMFSTGIAWGDPLLRVLVLWVGLLGALAASRDNKHISVDVLPRLLPRGARSAARAATSLFAATVSGLVAYHSGRFVAADFEAGIIAFAAVPAWACEIILPFAFAVIALRYLLLAAHQVTIRDAGDAP